MRIARIRAKLFSTGTVCAVGVLALLLTGVAQPAGQGAPEPVDQTTQQPDILPDQPTQAAPQTDTTPDFSTLPIGKVARILDENTVLIEIDDRTIRYDLLGVSAASTDRSAAHTQSAIDALSRMLLGESVAIEHDPQGERNIANRRAVYLYRIPDHLFVNLELVRQGYTRHSPISMTIHTKVFEHYQTRAQNLFRGIWDPQAPVQTIDETNSDQSPSQDDPESTQQSGGTAATVYITAYGTRYHTKDCPHLTDTTRPTTRDQIKDSHKPCKTCKPDDG